MTEEADKLEEQYQKFRVAVQRAAFYSSMDAEHGDASGLKIAVARMDDAFRRYEASIVFTVTLKTACGCKKVLAMPGPLQHEWVMPLHFNEDSTASGFFDGGLVGIGAPVHFPTRRFRLEEDSKDLDAHTATYVELKGGGL